eukprot:s50_g40.t1
MRILIQDLQLKTAEQLDDYLFFSEAMAGQMFVVKRDGQSQEKPFTENEVKFDNITKRIRTLCDGLDPRFIDPVPVTQKVVEGLRLMGIPLVHTSCGPMLWKFCTFDIEIQGLPQLCRAPCTLPNCVRCDRQLGGFKFPWLGTWNSRGVIVPPGVQPDEAWRRYYENQEPMDLIMVNMYCGATTAKDVVPQYLYELQLRISSGQTGQFGMGEFFAAWRDWLLCFNELGFPARFCDPRLFPKSPRATLAGIWGRGMPSTTLLGWVA